MTGKKDEEDREAILARRAVFIASAIAGLAGIGCSDGKPTPCLSATVLDVPPQPCLSPPPMQPDAGATIDGGGLPADADGGVADAGAGDAGAGDAGAGDAGASDAGPRDAGARKPPGAKPQPCLTQPRPQPCLIMVPPDDDR